MWGSDGSEGVCVCLLGCDAVWTCVQIQTFRRNIFNAEDGGSVFYLQVHTALKPGRPTQTGVTTFHKSENDSEGDAAHCSHSFYSVCRIQCVY
jgi:hypothetical protein